MMNHRVSALREEMKQAGLDALLISKPENRRYLSGFTGTSANLIVTLDQTLMFTDFRYLEQASSQCQGWTIVEAGSSFVDTVAAVLRENQVLTLGFESSDLSYALVESYRAWEHSVPSLQLVPTERLVESLRVVKDADEIRRIKKAASIADDTFAHMLTVLRPGITERDAALELEHHMLLIGASTNAFTTIIASGQRSALPHGVASDKVLESGDFVTMDFGAVYEGYVSDLTRTVCLGNPSPKQREIYAIVREAQERAIDGVSRSMMASDLDALARDLIDSNGYADAFGHGLGHGIGLEIHENPRIRQGGRDVLLPGMTFTIEPGIYLKGEFGVRIEDDVLLTERAGEVLTHASKDLICL